MFIKSRPLQICVGVTAMIAPAIHSVTDVMEWWFGGFTERQLWINLVAFLPMPLLLLGICTALDRRATRISIVGAVLYGASFSYFIYTTIYAIERKIPDYETLWTQLGPIYTMAGAFMVAGGILFSIGALKSSPLPKVSVWLFLCGILANLVLAIIPAPDILQTVGSGIRNAGLIIMGYYVVSRKILEEA
jgi:hypothetical protein